MLDTPWPPSTGFPASGLKAAPVMRLFGSALMGRWKGHHIAMSVGEPARLRHTIVDMVHCMAESYRIGHACCFNDLQAYAAYKHRQASSLHESRHQIIPLEPQWCGADYLDSIWCKHAWHLSVRFSCKAECTASLTLCGVNVCASSVPAMSVPKLLDISALA